VTADQARRVLGLVGLGVRARNATVGVEQVRAAAKKDLLVLALVASDAAEHSLDKLRPLLRARRIPTIEGLAAAELGAAAGRTKTAAIGIVDRPLANGILGVVETGADRPT
jgi:ribosomal protein L7Ae-like RNA K-turn-binding protein